jgi:hypothetical protein
MFASLGVLRLRETYHLRLYTLRWLLLGVSVSVSVSVSFPHRQLATIQNFAHAHTRHSGNKTQTRFKLLPNAELESSSPKPRPPTNLEMKETFAVATPPEPYSKQLGGEGGACDRSSLCLRVILWPKTMQKERSRVSGMRMTSEQREPDA